MLDLLELIAAIGEAIFSWRFYVSLGVAIAIAWVVHSRFPDASWTWFVSVPLVLAGSISGILWERRSG